MARWTKPEVRRGIVEVITPVVRAAGFRFEKTSETIVRNIEGSRLPMVRDRFLPFFDEYRDVAAVNRGLNPEGAARVFRIVSDRRAFDASSQP
jgi:hypothetical protein